MLVRLVFSFPSQKFVSVDFSSNFFLIFKKNEFPEEHVPTAFDNYTVCNPHCS